MSLLFKENSSTGSELVSTAEVKNFIKVDSDLTEDDTLIDDLVVSARLFVEGYMNQSTISYNVTVRFEDKDFRNSRLFLKYRANPTGFALTRVYEGTSSTVATTVYEINEFENCIQLKYGQEWPDAEYFEATYDSVVITKKDVKITMLNHIYMDYEYRKGGKEMQFGKIRAALSKHRIWMYK